MFANTALDINSVKSGLLYLAGQSYCKKGRSAKVKAVIINLILMNYLIDLYIFLVILVYSLPHNYYFLRNFFCGP
jgi:hypothetical protein